MTTLSVSEQLQHGKIVPGNYVYTQDNYVYMQDNYVYMQDNYVYMYT